MVENTNISQTERFNNLIFITSSKLLELNIGKTEKEELLNELSLLNGIDVVDIGEITNPHEAKKIVQSHFNTNTKGVVIIGGYDVVPSFQLDVLTKELREELTENDEIDDDGDAFIVWSDDLYVDTDGDTFPELPISRIPDGKSASLIGQGLRVKQFKIDSRIGIRNLERPFAEETYQNIPAQRTFPLAVSEQCSPQIIPQDSLTGAVYFMLHGSDADGTRFWGETKEGGYYDAMDISNIPTLAENSLIFSGCCWGALIALPLAYKKRPETKIRARTIEQSIPLTYLNAGAIAFIGCTGAHYSPRKEPYNFFGKPMHDAFWDGIAKGYQPAQALFEAKKRYAAEMPHNLTKSLSIAIEMKILRQFTCLGLGW